MALPNVGARAVLENVGAFITDAGRMDRSLDSIGSSGIRAGDNLKSGSMMGVGAMAALGVAAVAAAAGVVFFAKDAVKAASDMIETQNKVQVVFGQSAASVTAFAEDAAQKLGMARQEALAAAGTFGNLFVSMGIGQEKAADMSQGLLTLAADLASFNNIDPSVALEKLRAGLVGETEPLRTLGVNLSAAQVETQALAMGFQKVNGELSASSKAQAAYALILAQTKTAQGDFANTSTGMANSLRIIEASFKDVQAEIGAKLLPILAPLISNFAKALPGALATTGAALTAAWAALEPMRNLLQITGDILRVWVIPAFQSLAAGDFGKAFEQIGAGASVAEVLIREAFQNALTWLRDRVVELTATMDTWGQTLVDFIGPRIPQMLQAFLDMRVAAFDWLIAQLPGLIETLGRWGAQLVAWIAPMIQPALVELGKFLSKTLDWIIAKSPELTEKFIGEWVPAAIGWVAKAAVALLKELPGILVTIGTWIVTEGAPKLAELALKLGAAVIRGIITGIMNGVGEIAGALASILPGGGVKLSIQSARGPNGRFGTPESAAAEWANQGFVDALRQRSMQDAAQIGSEAGGLSGARDWQRQALLGAQGALFEKTAEANAIARSLGLGDQTFYGIDHIMEFLRGIASMSAAARELLGEGVSEFAGGVQNFRGGMALVGERGPELVQLPMGASVTPMNRTTNYNLIANYTRQEEPQSIRYELETLALLSGR